MGELAEMLKVMKENSSDFRIRLVIDTKMTLLINTFTKTISLNFNQHIEQDVSRITIYWRRESFGKCFFD